MTDMQVALHVLKKIILMEKNGAFPDKNYFSIQVYNKLREYGMDYIKNKRFIDEIPTQTNDIPFEDQGEGIRTLEGTDIWDFRFRSFLIKGFRMFPFGKNNRYYGLNFMNANCTDNQPCSLFLVGANGSGKTSLYSSMEYHCTGNVSAAIARGIEEEHYTDYIAHAKSKKKPDTKVFLQEEKERQKDMVEVLNSLKDILPAFFCSEHEINKFCGKPEDLTSFFFEQIGYGNIVKLKEHLKCELSQIKKVIEAEGNEIQSPYRISNNQKKKLLEGVQSDVIAFVNWDTGKGNELRLSDIRIFSQDLYNQQIDWDEEWDIKHKYNTLKKLIFKLSFEKDSIIQHYGKTSTLVMLYSHFIASLEKIVHALSDKPENFFPKRFQRNELEFQVGKVDVKEFQVKRNYILEWYDKILIQFINEGKEKGAITIIKEICDEIRQIDQHIDDVSESEESIRLKYKTHHDYLSSLIDGIDSELKYIQEVIRTNTEQLKNKILSDFLLPSERISFDLSDDRKFISTIYFKEDGMKNEIPFEPREYFNSFRYKFYCILLKIVAAFTVKILFNLNFPLIFDDIFYSSDFSNRDKVGDFIASIYKIHDKIFKANESPLQIIFFTHDDLILEAAVKGTSGLDNSLCGRLFFYDEVEDDDIRPVDDIEFYNLYIPFT